MARRIDFGRGAPFCCSDYQRPGLAEEEVQEIKEVFDLFDYMGSGSINVNRLMDDVLVAFGSRKKAEAISGLIRQADMNGSGQLSFDEFLHMVLTIKTADDRTRADFKSVFGLFYDDQNGIMPHLNLCIAGRECGEGSSPYSDLSDHDPGFVPINLRTAGRECGESSMSPDSDLEPQGEAIPLPYLGPSASSRNEEFPRRPDISQEDMQAVLNRRN